MMNAEPTEPQPALPPNDTPPSPPSRLRQILDQRPEARGRIGRAVAALLGTALLALTALSALLIWHLIRRGRIIRERLGAPRQVRLPHLPEKEPPPDPPTSDPDHFPPEFGVPR